jgi:anti-sigma B factor antagonist
MSTGPSPDSPPTPLTPFSVECSRRETGPTIALVLGDVDIATADLLLTAVTAGAEPSPQAGVVLELTGVDFMDSTGLRAVLEIAGRLAEHGGGLVLLNPVDAVAKLLTLAGIDERIPVAESLEQADAMLAAPGTGA